jgi:peptide/nickel transport system permease protein
MIGFLVNRLAQSAVVMLAVALIAFALFNFVGDPVQALVSETDTVEFREGLRERLGLNSSVWVQFGRFVGNAARGEFGRSYTSKQPVARLIAERLPATLELVLVAASLAMALGITLGVYTAVRRTSLLSQALQALSLVGISVPTFVTGIMLILVFSVQLRVLPSFGRGEVVDLGWWRTGFLSAEGWKALIMPALTLALFSTTLIMRLVRSEMLEVLRTDYIKFARGRGLSDRAIYLGHALRNTLIPVVTVAGLQIGSLIAFAIITETVFQWPGMGLLFIQAVTSVDIPVMSAYLVLVSLMFVGINFVVDLLYYTIDPRLRVSRAAGTAAGI